ncbi:APC membrane recruitment protein 3 [Saguinus oedipus]|uniref:APC membrane recruitment protein 3 n=1 Tax=Saguinus oedipus TaxID=9490 RepID=A0ABQ9TBG3_SAGOE|nr:APC membrane recruitment protein 3 [Saguinus oedipus]
MLVLDLQLHYSPGFHPPTGRWLQLPTDLRIRLDTLTGRGQWLVLLPPAHLCAQGRSQHPFPLNSDQASETFSGWHHQHQYASMMHAQKVAAACPCNPACPSCVSCLSATTVPLCPCSACTVRCWTVSCLMASVDEAWPPPTGTQFWTPAEGQLPSAQEAGRCGCPFSCLDERGNCPKPSTHGCSSHQAPGSSHFGSYCMPLSIKTGAVSEHSRAAPISPPTCKENLLGQRPLQRMSCVRAVVRVFQILGTLISEERKYLYQVQPAGFPQETPDPAATAPTREGTGPWSVLPGGQPRHHVEKGPQASPSAQGYDRCSKKGAQLDLKGGPAALCGTTFKPVRKSKTHNSVSGAGRPSATTGKLVGSANFPGSLGSQRMIDYRHFMPQMPFMPAVAKSILRKRISLKRPKKCFWNLFHIRRNKAEDLASLAAEGKSLPSAGDPSDPGGLDSLCQDLSDSELLANASFGLCRALCEDVASLQSFDLLKGCGEIFADESSVPSLELNEGPESPTQAAQGLKSKVPRGPLQGSVEQLASPVQNETSDFIRFWDSHQCALLGPGLAGPQGTDRDQPWLDIAGLAELPLCPCGDPHGGSKASSIDTGTPKSEQPESVSTSDEGCYDSFLPGLEEDKKEAKSSHTLAATFPRDSYSADALYELFHDPSEGPVYPSPDVGLCMYESLSRPALGAPLSLCSFFRVGAKENLAPAPGPDLLSQGFLQSSWKGKECLLKLSDTELAITMGIVSWLCRGPMPHVPPTPGQCAAPSGPQGAPRAPTEKLGGRDGTASDAGGATVCSAPSRQELWAHPGTTGPLAGESKALGGPHKGPACCPGMPLKRKGHEVSLKAYTSSKSKAPIPSAWPCSQKEPGSPGVLGCFQGLWRPGHGGGTLDAEPMLVGFVAHVAALKISSNDQPLATWPPRLDMGSGLFGQCQARVPDILEQKQSSSSPSMATVHGLPYSASTQDQRSGSRWSPPG